MENLLRNVLAGVKLGQEQSYQNMAVLALLREKESSLDFITLDEALDQKFLTITEVDESGTVPELKVSNISDHKILLLDGEELVGAKQNRVLNVTILVAPHSELKIPVSCVEQGRWSYDSREFSSASRHMSADLRKKKSRSVHENLSSRSSFASNQGEVWEEIEVKFSRMAEPQSPTRALSDLYISKQTSVAEYQKSFSPQENQIGMAVLIDGALAGIEFLDKYEKFRQLHKKLVTSYIMDALETVNPDKEYKADSSKEKVLDYLTVATNAVLELRPSVALGQDVRLDSDGLMGAGLEFEGQILQLSLFLKNNNGVSRKRESSMQQASRRRNSLRRR